MSGLVGIQYVSSATYNAQGQLTQLVNENGNGANGLTRQWTYETNTLRLSSIQAGTNVTFDNLQKLTYSYDNAGNVTSLVDTVNSGQRQCFQYDWLSRLTGAFTGDATCTSLNLTGIGIYSHNYGYDALGNITNNAGNAYTYGDAAHKHAVTVAFGNSYGYDGNGNQTTRIIGGVTYTFTYDYENHLTAITGGSVNASFVYDADGNRVKGTVVGITTVYIAGLYEYQGGATTRYYEGNALRRAGYASDNGVFYLLQDQLKSSVALANQNGTVNSRNYFYPYGGNRGGGVLSPLTTKRFTGQYHEIWVPAGEGLSYYGARWYDAQLGRFTSPDSLVPSPGNPQTLNRYSYVLDNPTNYVDPTGHASCPPTYEYSGCESIGAGGGASSSGFGGGGFGGGGSGGSGFGGWFSGFGKWLSNWWSGVSRSTVDMSVYELQPLPNNKWYDLYTWERGGLTAEEAGRMAAYTEQNNATILYRSRPYGAVIGEKFGLSNKPMTEETVGKLKFWGVQLTKAKDTSSWWPSNWRGIRVSDTDVNAIVIENNIAPFNKSQTIANDVAQAYEINGGHNIQHGCNFWGICTNARGATWGRQEQSVYAMSPNGTITYWENGITALSYYAPGWSNNSAISLIGPR